VVNVPDPCNVIPDSTIPAGLSAHRHHAVHHVVGRIKHSIHHKFPIAGPHPSAPTPFGCEKHAILPPRPGGNGIVGPGAAVPGTKLAAIGGAGAGIVAIGGIGGIVGGIIPTVTKGKTTITGNGTTPVSTNPVPTTPVPPTTPTPPNTIVPPVGPTIPGTPPVSVTEPSTIVVFAFALGVALLARHYHGRRAMGAAVSSA
jgi:hypothetical protein